MHRSIRRALVGVALVATVVGTALTGCSSSSTAASSSTALLRIPREDFSTFTRNFNPFSPNALPMTTIAVYEPMAVVNPIKGNVVPWLASSWKVDSDGRGVTMQLRKGVDWSDGQPLTSADVVETFALQKKLLGGYTYLESVTAQGDDTVRFDFNTAYTPGFYEIASQVIVPKHVWAAVKDPAKFTNASPVGTGPYTKVASFQTQSYELDKNPHYWQPKKQQIHGVQLVAESGNTAASVALQSGQVDWGDQFVPNIQSVFVAKDPKHNHYWYPATGSTVQWMLNTTKAPFNDVAVRKALSMAVDRSQVVKLGMSGYAKPADCTGLSDRYDSWKSSSVVSACDWTKLDVAGANALLDKAGYQKGSNGYRTLKNGQPFAFKISVGATSSDWLSVAQVIAKNMAAIGVKVTVDAPDWSKVVDAYSKGTFDSGIVWTNAGTTPYEFYRGEMSTATVMPVGQTASQNYQRFGDAQATSLLAKFAATSNPDEQHQIADQLQARFSAVAPAIPLFPGPSWGAYSSKRFTGWPNAADPYADLSTRSASTVLVLTSLKPAS